MEQTVRESEGLITPITPPPPLEEADENDPHRLTAEADPMRALTAAKQVLIEALGEDHVRDGDSERDLHAGDLSFHAPHRPDLVVYPGSTDEVARVLALANEHRIP